MPNVKDGATGTVLTAPSPATSGLSLVLNSGEGLLMPATPFYAIAHPNNTIPTVSVSEKILVTGISTDTLTIVRAQGIYTAKSIAVGWRISNAIFQDDLNNASIIRNEVPGGTINGSNTAFTTASPAATATGSLSVFRNGVRLKPGGADFTQTSTGFTMVSAPPTGTVLLVDYIVAGALNNVGTNSLVSDEAVTGTVNSSNLIFTTARAYIAGSLEVFINGLKQYRTTDYAETTPGSGVFTFGAAPTTGDVIRVCYQFNLNPASNADTVDGYHATTTPSLNSVPATDADNALLANPYPNYVINGGCQVAQRAAPSLSTSSQYGKVDRFRVHGTGTAVTAGTITQGTAQTFAKTGNTLQVSGATITGTGVILVKHRIESKNASHLKNLIGSFVATVQHNVGSNINYTITIRKPTVADNFASVTDIGTITAAVATATPQKIRLENLSLGDVTNGIEIEISVACGAITTKTFDFCDFMFNQGAVAMGYAPRTFDADFAACQRYFEKSFPYATAPAQAAGNTGASTVIELAASQFARADIPFQALKRVAPTITAYNPISSNALGRDIDINADITTTDLTGDVSERRITATFIATAGGGQSNRIKIHWTADAEL